MKLLVIEDEPGIARVVRKGLEGAGFAVDTAEEGQDGLRKALSGGYGAILLDLMLPGLDGWQICEQVRAARITTPVLMLTARDAVPDRVKGLELGADDYLPKPFEFDELLARVRALIRRDRVHRVRIIRVADLEIDTGQRRARRGGQELPLSRREFDLLEALASREGQVLTREAIQERVWNAEDRYSNLVDVYIGLLRKKIDAGRVQKLIHTVHGVGYTLRLPEDSRP